MNTVYLVEESSYKDAEEGLKDRWDKGFLKGIDYCIEELDKCVSDIPSDDDDMLDKIRQSVAEKVIDKAKDWLYVSRCEAVVSFADNQASEDWESEKEASGDD